MLNKNLKCKPEIEDAFATLIKLEEQIQNNKNHNIKEFEKQKAKCNKALCCEFPFLQIKNAWTGEAADYSYTELDNMEPGWKKAFGLDMCIELKEALEKDVLINDFFFLEIKEKYGGLRLYANEYKENTKIILAKYEELSYYICGRCGKPATKISQGWIYPFCDECSNLVHDNFKKIEDCYRMLEPTVEKMIDRIVYNFRYDDFWDQI